MNTEKKDIVRLSSWVILFLLQLFFNIFPFWSLWIRAFFLSFLMVITTTLWIKIVEGRDIRSRLGLDEKGVTILTYVLLAAVLLFFQRNAFQEATMLTASSAIMPLFEELFFRAYLLGSMVEEWPLLHLPYIERTKLVKKALPQLFLTSISFALVHDDVISVLLSLSPINFNLAVIIIMRVLFGMAAGELYIFNKNFIAPAAFHVAFNLSYFLLAR